MTIRTSFRSGAEDCAAWLTLPAGEGPHPVVLLIHGGGATHSMMLDQYERRFSAAGFAVVAFDFRHLGESGGTPRQLMNLGRYFEDIDAALAFIRSRPELDPTRIALWGTSFGASHVVATAARRPGIAAAVVQCPILKGRAPALASGFAHLMRFTVPIVSDLVRAALGIGRRYVQIVGRPGELAFVNRPGAYEGWMSVVPAGVVFDGRITAGAAIGMLFYDAASQAARSRSGRSSRSRKPSASPWSTSRAGRRAPSSISATASWRRHAAWSSPRSPPSAFCPQGTCDGATIGAKADTAR